MTTILNGCYLNKNLPHYHIRILLPNGKTKQMYETFLYTNNDKRINAVTVNDIEQYVIDEGVKEPFTLYWKEKKLSNSHTKLRKIMVNKEKLPLYMFNPKEPIVVVLNRDLDPNLIEPCDIDFMDLDTRPSTPCK